MDTKNRVYNRIDVTEAVASDVTNIMSIAERFFNESDNKHLHFSRGLFGSVLNNIILDQDSKIFIAKSGDNIVGYIIIERIREYTIEYIGQLCQFFVDRDFRGTNVARLLVGRASEQFKEWDCSLCYSEAAPGMGGKNIKMFSNLWKKFGFYESGIILTRTK